MLGHGKLVALLATVTLVGSALSACGSGSGSGIGIGQTTGAPLGAIAGVPIVATKNTTRIAGASAAADAAATALAVYPSAAPGTQPPAVVFADSADWHAALLAGELMARPVRAPLLLDGPGGLPRDSATAFAALAPTGSPQLGGAKAVLLGNVADPRGTRATRIADPDPYTLAANVAAFAAAARGTAAGEVIVVAADAPQYALPAASWAAKSGDPILFVDRSAVPAPTRSALQRLTQPRIYLLAPESIVDAGTATALARYGKVQRIAGADPSQSSVAFARFSDGSFGWDLVDPGHGLVFVNGADPVAAAAAAPLSGSGTYGPMLVLDAANALPDTVRSLLLDIEPGFAVDPARGVYNHGWLIGDQRSISLPVQAQIDSLLEIAPVTGSQAAQ